MQNKEINQGHYIEFMDRLHVVMHTIDVHLLKHPLADQDIRLRSLLEKAIEDLWDAYQISGIMDHDLHSPK
jgi:hypothetical protein